MIYYGLTKEQAGLEPWAPLTDAGAEILGGDPQQAGRVDYGSWSANMTVGVWECSVGKFKIKYGSNETCTFTKGKVTITDESGQSKTYGPGDSHFVAKGEVLVWDVHEPVKKSFIQVWDDLNERVG